MASIIAIHTDGAASGNPGPGGYGIVMTSGSLRKEFSRGFRLTTNNRMELMAVVDALVKIKRPNCEVHIYSDSKYVVDSIEKKWIEKWKKKGFVKTKNTDLWKLLLPLLTKHKVQFHWVKGHASNIENNRCDYLAVQASRAIQLEEDKGYLQILKEN